MGIWIRSRSRVFPECHVISAQPKVTSLSIIDATVLNFAKCACVWFYDDPLDIDLLNTSLRKTLNAYPQWAGQLRFVEYDRNAGHGHRQGRLELSYGSPSDPGVECILAEANLPKSSLFPPSETADCWDATHVDYRVFLDEETNFALYDSKEYDDLPSMKVQFTTFEDDSSGVAVAVSMVHSLADAAALLTFMKDWAATNRAISSSKPVPHLQPLFNPSLIDAAAAGDIDAPHPDPSILRLAAKLPVHRFDYWASAGPSTPPWSLPLTEIPQELASQQQDIGLGNPVPYHTWDTTAPVSHATFFFSPAETHAIYLRAAKDSEIRISHQDALLAHLWAALIRARGLKEGEEHFLDISIDGRRRLDKPLAPAFIGSPIFNAGVSTGVTATSSSASGAKDLSDKAAAIRRTVAKFNGENLAALLHEMCFELSAQRRWNCFLGDYHCMVTSWIGVGVDEVVFEEGKKVRWAEPLLPLCDGVVVVGEGGAGRDDDDDDDLYNDEKEGGRETTKEWWRKGVKLIIYLRSDVMGRLMEDEGLRLFAEGG